jgi:hypothetical protein
VDLREAHEHGRRRLLRDVRPDLPDDFITAVEMALSPRPEGRYATAGEMEAALRRISGLEGTEAERVARPSPASLDRARRRRRRRVLGTAAAAAAAAGVVTWIALRPEPPGSPGAGPKAPVGVAAELPPPSVPETLQPHGLDVQADLYRKGALADELLEDGSRVAPGDALYLQLRSEDDLHVYVVNVDGSGQGTLLFPLDSLEMKNPLHGGQEHLLPGAVGGRRLGWQVSQPGGEEAFIVVASRERLSDLESELAGLRAAREGESVQVEPFVVAALRGYRGIKGLVETGAPSPGGPEERIARILRDAQQSRGAGLWIKEYRLSNPPG